MIKKFSRKINNLYRYITTNKKSNLNYLSYTTDKKRILSHKKLDLPKNIIVSTYFSSKPDPQRNVIQNSNDFEYIKVFYDSVTENNLSAVIFHDSLSEAFVEEFTNKNIKFIKCDLGTFSLNDERYFIYKEFLKDYPIEKIIMCDVNDVYLKKGNVFDFIKENKLYIGRDEAFLLRENPFMTQKIDILSDEITSKLDREFYIMPVVNAGVIAGCTKTVTFFLDKLTSLLFMNNNDNNNNMACVNIVFYDFYWRSILNSLQFKINSTINKNYYNSFSTNKTYRGKNVYIGAPFVSEFKKFQDPNKTDYYIYHK